MLLRGFAIGVLLQANACLAASDDILGIWDTEDGDSRVEIYRCDVQSYCGRLVWLKEPLYPGTPPAMEGQPKLDSRNDEAALRTRPLLGLEILTRLRADGENLWVNDADESYDPHAGHLTSATATLNKSGVLKIRWGSVLLGSSEKWQRWKSTEVPNHISPERSAIRALKRSGGAAISPR